MSWLNASEIQAMGFGSLGNDVYISRHARLYNCPNIHIGDHVRIDDFCVLSAGVDGIQIGNYVHIAVFCSLIGQASIRLDDFSGLSSRVSIYSSNDDYSGSTLTNPTVPDAYKNVRHAPVHIGRHVIIGSGSVVLPGVTLSEGAAIATLALVKEDCLPFRIYAGTPARCIGERARDLLKCEERLKLDSQAKSATGIKR
ncbi:acyltransferase [Pseudothauera lacus]|uniref:Galactoside O-acetyltransferase n=1 Tax=Pseudothauera lacus TaxID=2136175 RepID=A0A2T4IHZ1_9RHOO|nr:acyltransferase [Pseudothauera lacus]PTD97388.1 galactoside O-acetyltransferase [Pseudothauera lacus]